MPSTGPALGYDLLIVWRHESPWGVVPKCASWDTATPWQCQRGSCPILLKDIVFQARESLRRDPITPSDLGNHPCVRPGKGWRKGIF